MTCSGRGIGNTADATDVTGGTGATDVAGAGMATDHARIAAYAQTVIETLHAQGAGTFVEASLVLSQAPDQSGHGQRH
jgi:hypothetical protein